MNAPTAKESASRKPLAPESDVVVTLVHGTWARNAAWTRASSTLRRELAEKIPRLRNVAVFSWTGRNSHRARVDAAQMLIEHDRAVRAEYPGARHYIIAHSHGGNVALYACEDETFRRCIAGIACLSTPFLRVRPVHVRLDRPSDVWAILTGFWLGLFWLSTTLGWLGFAWVLRGDVHVAIRLLTLLAIGPLVWSATMPVVRVINGIGEPRLDSANREYLAWDVGFSQRIEDDVDLLIIRAAGDEASAALSTMRAASWLAEKAYGWLLPVALLPTRIVDGLFRQRRTTLVIAIMILAWVGTALWALLAMIPVASFVLPISPGNPHVTRLHEIAAMAWPLLALAAPLLVTGVLTVVVAATIAICRIPFGFSSKLEQFGYQVSAEASPPGKWVVHQLEVDLQATGELAHSEPYSQPEAISLIIDWIRGPARMRS